MRLACCILTVLTDMPTWSLLARLSLVGVRAACDAAMRWLARDIGRSAEEMSAS